MKSLLAVLLIESTASSMHEKSDTFAQRFQRSMEKLEQQIAQIRAQLKEQEELNELIWQKIRLEKWKPLMGDIEKQRK